MLLVIFDGLLCMALLATAWIAIRSDNLFRSVALFMVFGLLMAVTWARLQAPDLALAEAVIGSGITGALLFNACKARVQVRAAARSQQEPEAGSPVPDVLASETLFAAPPLRFRVPRSLLVSGCAGLSLVLAWLLSQLEPARATATLADQATRGHVMSNPVTAVLLDLRGYDTLLEMVVLLLAVLAMRLLNIEGRLPELYPADAPRPALLDPLIAIMFPVVMLVSLYLYWAGSARPGGAFQAGALLAAGGILMRLGGRLDPQDQQPVWLRGVLIIGMLSLCGFALASLTWAGDALTHPQQGNYYGMLVIEGCMAVSIAATLVLLFADAPAVRLRRSR